MYSITKYSYDKAKDHDLIIKPSNRKQYKIDVYDKKGGYITSIGSKNYSDYPNYIQTHGIDYANERRRLYYIRHAKDDNIRGHLAKLLLW